MKNIIFLLSFLAFPASGIQDKLIDTTTGEEVFVCNEQGAFVFSDSEYCLSTWSNDTANQQANEFFDLSNETILEELNNEKDFE